MHPLQNTQIPELPKALSEEMLEEIAVFAMEADEDEGAGPNEEAIQMAAWVSARVMRMER